MAGPEPDEQAIRALVVEYARCVDAGDFDGLQAVFTPDATAELGGNGQSSFEELRARMGEALGRFASWEHIVGDTEVRLDGDTATASTPILAHHYREPGQEPPVYTLTGTYEDRLVRDGSGWRIEHRSLVVSGRQGRQRTA